MTLAKRLKYDIHIKQDLIYQNREAIWFQWGLLSWVQRLCAFESSADWQIPNPHCWEGEAQLFAGFDAAAKVKNRTNYYLVETVTQVHALHSYWKGLYNEQLPWNQLNNFDWLPRRTAPHHTILILQSFFSPRFGVWNSRDVPFTELQSRCSSWLQLLHSIHLISI